MGAISCVSSQARAAHNIVGVLASRLSQSTTGRIGPEAFHKLWLPPGPFAPVSSSGRAGNAGGACYASWARAGRAPSTEREPPTRTAVLTIDDDPLSARFVD